MKSKTLLTIAITAFGFGAGLAGADPSTTVNAPAMPTLVAGAADASHPDMQGNPASMDKPDVDRHDIEHASVDKPDVERPDIEKPEVEKPEVSHPEVSHPETNR